jgi:protein SCO1/2
MSLRKDDRPAGIPASHRALWGALALVLIGVVALGTRSLLRGPDAVGSRGPARSPTLSVYGVVPDFSFVERSGRTIERSEFLGKVWVIDFIYTRCADTCPLQSAEMKRLQADLATEPDVRLVSITVDPMRDTAQVLTRYANRFRADPRRWLFLTGDKEAIYRFAMRGLHLPLLEPGRRAGPDAPGPTAGLLRLLEPNAAAADDARQAAPPLHSSRFVLVDRQAQIRGYYESANPRSLESLRKAIRVLLSER